jgi:hypothetical protein
MPLVLYRHILRSFDYFYFSIVKKYNKVVFGIVKIDNFFICSIVKKYNILLTKRFFYAIL